MAGASSSSWSAAATLLCSSTLLALAVPMEARLESYSPSDLGMKLIWNSFRFLVIGLIFNGLVSAGFFSVVSMSKFSVCVCVTTAAGGGSFFSTGGGFFFTLRFDFTSDGGLGGVAGGRDGEGVGGDVGGGVGGRGGGGGGVTGFATSGSYKWSNHAFLVHEHGYLLQRKAPIHFGHVVTMPLTTFPSPAWKQAI